MADNAPPLPPPPRPPPPPLQQQSPLTYPYSLNFQSSTSVAIIIVVLGATFFFMFLFVIYVKRCNTEQFNHGDRIASAAGMSGSDGSSNNAGTWNQHHSHIHGLDPAVLQKFPVLRFSSAVALDRSGSNGGSGGGGGGAKNKRSNTAKRGSGSTGTAAKIVDGPIECAVCLGAFEEGEFLRILPACGHLFHPDCIDAWLGTHSTCPLCRRSLSRDAMSGHLLQKALAAIASLRGLANFGSSNETGSSSPESSLSHASPPPPVPHEVASRPRLVQPDLEILLDLESQQEQRQQQQEEGSEQGQIIRTLSRNSESFKVAAQSVEIQDRLVATSSSSSRYYNSLSNPSSSAMLGFVSPGRLRSLAQPAAMSPIACGRIHHSHSLTNLLAGNSSPLNPCSLCGQPDQQLRLWRSVSASGQRINPGRES